MLLQMGGESARFFDCDREVGHLMESGRLARDLLAAFGAGCLSDDNSIDRNYLRELVFNRPEARRKLEELIHPRIMQMCRMRLAEAAASGKISHYIVDIPLFFESGERIQADKVCVVAASRETQIARIAERNSLSAEMAERIIDSQMPTQEKIDRADVVFWNDGPLRLLREQVKLFFSACLEGADDEEEAQAEPVNLDELRALPLGDLRNRAEDLALRNVSSLARAQLVFEIGQKYLSRDVPVYLTGVVEQAKEHYAMLRDPRRSFRTSPDDVYLSGDLIKKYKLRPGNMIKVLLRRSRSHDKFLAAGEVLEIEGIPAEQYRAGAEFEKLTPLFPKERLLLENKKIGSAAMRVLDLVTPLGKGQRGLIVAPPRGGKTVLLKTIARSLRENYPEVHLLVLLLDERPEEVTDFEESVDVPVYASTFDEPSRRHAQVSDLSLERAKRLVEQGKDVIILLDSLTRLARGYNANQTGGRVMSGGLGSNALEKPRKFFGAARNVEEGGSLTIIATCLVDTESRMDEIIFEEFKGTGNMEIRLDRELAERRIYPAISISLSGTRNDDRLYHEDEMPRVLSLRRQLAQLPGWEGLELLLKNISKTQNNAELLLRGLR